MLVVLCSALQLMPAYHQFQRNLLKRPVRRLPFPKRRRLSALELAHELLVRARPHLNRAVQDVSEMCIGDVIKFESRE